MKRLNETKLQEQIRGMKLLFKIEAPHGVNLEPIVEQIETVFAFARKDPDQFGLFEPEDKPAGTAKKSSSKDDGRKKPPRGGPKK